MESWIFIVLAVHFTFNICLGWFISLLTGEGMKFGTFLTVLFFGWMILLYDWITYDD